MKPKIIVCDDQEGIRESLKLILEKDYDVTIATNGEECLERLKNFTADLIMLDIKMPKVSGMDILKKIKSQNPNAKVVMVTGYRLVDVATEAVKAGADDYLIKPFSSKDILDAVKRVLG